MFIKINDDFEISPDRKLVCVTGLGRSRTSFTMNILKHLGYEVFQDHEDKNELNPDGYFESNFWTKPLCRELFLNYTNPENFYSKKIIFEKHYNETFNNFITFISKRKKICLKTNINIVLIFLEYFTNIKVLFLNRINIKEYAKSKVKIAKKYPEAFFSKKTIENANNLDFFLLQKKSILNRLSECLYLVNNLKEKNNIEFHLINYEDFNINLDLTIEKIIKITKSDINRKNEIKKLYKNKKYEKIY